MKTFDHVPTWLGADDHAAQLLRDGWSIDATMNIVERAAIYHHDAKLGDLHGEIQATIDHTKQAPRDMLT